MPFCGKFEINLRVNYNLKTPQIIESAAYVFTFLRSSRCYILCEEITLSYGKLRTGYQSALVYQYQTEEPQNFWSFSCLGVCLCVHLVSSCTQSGAIVTCHWRQRVASALLTEHLLTILSVQKVFLLHSHIFFLHALQNERKRRNYRMCVVYVFKHQVSSEFCVILYVCMS